MDFTLCFSAPIVDFKQVNADWIEGPYNKNRFSKETIELAPNLFQTCKLGYNDYKP